MSLRFGCDFMMARKGPYSDFDCPQFIDFVAELDVQDNVLFASAKQECCSTPTSASLCVGGRGVSTKFTEPDNEALFDQNQKNTRTRSTQIDHKSPKPSNKAVKNRLERSPCVNLERRSPYEMETEGHPRRRSQSESSIRDAVKSKIGFCIPIPRERSSSADDVRIKRKVTYPTTPLCLKRPKKDKNIKTTEELELEKIAQLQKELRDHLRFNEMSMKRLGLRKKLNPQRIELPEKVPPCLFKAPEPPREADKFSAGKRVNASNNLRKIDEEIRSKFKNSKAAHVFLAPSTFRKEIGSQKETRNLSSHSASNVSTISCCSGSDVEKNTGAIPKKPLGVKNTAFHSGLKFSSNYQKVTLVKPFTFEKLREGGSKAESEKANELCVPNRLNIPSTRNMKENIPRRTNTDVRCHKKKL